MLAGTANVIMQLSRPEVGYGVVESTVRSGQVTRHPLKRFRTTFTYLAVAMLGTERERERYRRAVDGAHASVHSGPHSPVAYNAFDPELQLWVAACLYKGAEDVARLLDPGGGDIDDADAFYRRATVLGTMLQVRPQMWPADRAAFARYWEEALTRIRIDPPVRRYLYDLATLRFLGPAALGQGRLNLWLTTGFLPPAFRRAMELDWAPEDQARFEQFMRVLGTVRRPLPGVLRRFPLDWFLVDFRLRSALGLRLL